MNGLNAVRVQYRSMIGGVERLPSVASAPRHRRRSARVVAVLMSPYTLTPATGERFLKATEGAAQTLGIHLLHLRVGRGASRPRRGVPGRKPGSRGRDHPCKHVFHPARRPGR
jgi:hypothetical protein